MEQLNEYKNTKKIGDKIKLKIVRASKEQEVELTLASDTTVTFNTSTSSNNR